VVRENMPKQTYLENSNNSIIRSKEHFKALFEMAGYDIKERETVPLSDKIAPVATFVLTPQSDDT